MSSDTNNMENMTPEQYIQDELNKARVGLKRTQIFGTIVILALCGETALVSGKFAFALQPKEAATIATGMVADQLDQHGDEIQASIAEKIPAMIQQSPDYVISQLPGYRMALEDKVNDALMNYTKSTTDALGARLDDYIDDNKTQIQAVLDNSNDPNALKALGPGLRQQIKEYLAQKPADGGESVTDQISEALTSLQDVQAKVHHLAVDNNLSPTDKMTRHALAVIASSVSKENLEPIPIKEAMPSSGGAPEEASADTAGE